MMTTSSSSGKSRHDYFVALEEIVAALLDEGLISYGSVRFTQQGAGGADSFYGYIVANAGSLDEARYDRLREIVDASGGKLHIPSSDKMDNEGGNVRIWPNA